MSLNSLYAQCRLTVNWKGNWNYKGYQLSLDQPEMDGQPTPCSGAELLELCKGNYLTIVNARHWIHAWASLKSKQGGMHTYVAVEVRQMMSQSFLLAWSRTRTCFHAF